MTPFFPFYFSFLLFVYLLDLFIYLVTERLEKS